MKEYIDIQQIVQLISSNRLYMMGIAMLSIMLFHLGVPPFSWCGYWGVDIFLFVSGFGIHYSLTKDDRTLRFYVRRFWRIMPTAIFCGWLFYFLNCTHGSKLLCLFGLNLWYIRTIIIFYLASPFIHNTLRQYGFRAFVFLIISSAIGCALLLYCPVFPTMPSTITWSVSRFPVYLAGLYLPIFAKKGLCINFRHLLITALLGLMILSILRMVQNAINADFEMLLFMPSILLVPAIIILALAFSSVFRYIPRIIILSLSLLGTFSLEIYLVHESLFKWKHLSYLLCTESSTIHLLTKFLLSVLLAVSINQLVSFLKRSLMPRFNMLT